MCACKIGSCKKRITIARKKAAVKADVIINYYNWINPPVELYNSNYGLTTMDWPDSERFSLKADGVTFCNV